MNELQSEIHALEFRHVSFSFDEKQVLNDICFKLRVGQMICITGASASGKSVLLHLAMGLLKPDRGQVLVEGRDIETMDEAELLALRGGFMGIVFQEDALFTGLSVYDNAGFRLAEHREFQGDIEPRVLEALRFVGLSNERDTLPEDLSGGMKRRLEFARALCGWPRIMLYDEPTEGLDPINATQILDLMIRARDIHHVSSLWVTKNLEEIPYVASHRATLDETNLIAIRKEKAPEMVIMLLDEGEIAFMGSPEEFVSSALPSVTYMTHPEKGTRPAESYKPDPWSKKRRPKSPK